TYMHPVRLYLVISLLFFTVFAFYVTNQVDENTAAINMDSDDNGSTEAVTMLDTDSTGLQRIVITGIRTDSTEFSDTIMMPKESAELLSRNPLAALAPIRGELSETDTTDQAGTEEDTALLFKGTDFTQLNTLMDNKNLSEKEITDSLKLEKDGFESWLVSRIVRLNRADNKDVVSYILKNVPLMMFILMPLFAIVLKMMYFRRDSLYIHHLVHSLHLHSFALITLLLIIGILSGGTWTGFLVPCLLVALFAYLFFSFKKVYRQKTLKTLVKLVLALNAYAFIFLLATLVELIISLALY
ncbi:MAG: hypothetical protein WBH03_12655, partial [Cyclobacteriaceae bacterium]